MNPHRSRIPKRWILGAALVFGLALLAVHAPRRETVVITYRGTVANPPKELIVFQTMRAKRCVPFVTCMWHYWSGTSLDSDLIQHRIPAGPRGASFEVNTARVFSLGAYELERMTVAANPDPQKGMERHLLDRFPPREREFTKGGYRVLYHILDLGLPNYFKVPVMPYPPEAETIIDFDPILYTGFEGLRDEDLWRTDGTRCMFSSDTIRISSSVPEVLRYRTFVLPRPEAGQRRPLPGGPTAVFLVDGTELTDLDNERPDPAAWERLKQRAIQYGKLRISHDAAARTITVELAGAAEKGDLLDHGRLFLVAGTPSGDGRFFGIDCVRFGVRER
jgi:hypothetical protein